MPPEYRRARRTSAAIGSSWSHICAACKVVVDVACDRGDVAGLRLYAGASKDTLARMLASDGHGGWTGPRIVGLRDYEEQVLRSASVRAAMVGAAVVGEASAVERDADNALEHVLSWSAELARLRANGLTRAELRRLLQLLPTVESDLARFKRDAKARLLGKT